MKVGYARTSTTDQTAGFDAQLAELTQAGCEKVFREQVSSVAPRAQLEAALYPRSSYRDCEPIEASLA